MDNITHDFIRTNGIRLHVVSAGNPQATPVILLHGFPEFWYGWRKQIPALTEAGYRVIVPDQRGYNLSDKPRGIKNYGLDILAADILGLMDALGYDHAYLVGHDWGAAVVWYLVTHHPQRLIKLVNLNVPHMNVMSKTLRKSLVQLRRSSYIFFFQIPFYPEWLLVRNKAEALTRLMKSSSHRGSFTDADLNEYRNAWLQPGALTGMLNWYRNAVRSGLRGLFSPISKPRITVPTLLLWGALDGALGREMAQPSIDLCESGKLVFFERATHWLQHDEADGVNKEIINFFKAP